MNAELNLAMIDLDLEFTLREKQKECLQTIMNDKGLLAIIPTSGGKTIIGVMACKYSKEIKNMKSCLLAPLVALTTEHVETFQSYGLRTKLDNGENPLPLEEYMRDDFDLVISTYEKMDHIIRSKKRYRDKIFEQLDCIVVDEIHSIEDESRGVNLESFIMSVKYLYPHIKIIGLSATVGNYNEFADWLEVPVIFEDSSNRPVPLEINIFPIYSHSH